MKTTRVTVRFARGLHARTAVSVAQLFKKFHCRILLRVGNRVATPSNILSILLLAATANTQLEIQASGPDEEAAVRAAEAFFRNEDEPAAEKIWTGILPPGSSPEKNP